MKRLPLFLATFLTVSTCFGQRLPELARPVNYQLTFAPDFDKDNFAGQETISIEVLKATSEIVLNSVALELQDASITVAGTSQRAHVSTDAASQTLKLSVERALPAGPANITIRYTGRLNDELRGFYLGKDEQGRKYAVTQFEATDARRAFPSFDEPSYKATFDISVVADKKHTVISNSNIRSDEPGPIEGKHTVTFTSTPKMSSYLVAIAVGEFEAVEGEADGIPIRVWGTPGKKQLGAFSLEAAQSFMHYFNQYFGIKYPYAKLDLIGLPDFSAGAMENTACITFREVLLLIDDKHASVGLKREVAAVISHEMAHMWFGDLVTMQWWNDIWLNEGFATWMESKPVAAWKPDWHVDLEDVRDTLTAQDVDSLRNTRPIQQNADTPDQINELFDGIAYGKTAAVLRMLEAYLGPKQFRAGVNAYLKQHAYANATATDFWNTLASVSGKPVDRVMAAFVKQPGTPFVAMQTRCSGKFTEVTLEQRRYFYDRASFNDDRSKELWEIPVCLKDNTVKSANERNSCQLLTQKRTTFRLSGCAPWILANAGASGFYHSGYEPGNMRALAYDVDALTPAELIALLGDTWAAVRVGKQPISDFVLLAEGLRNETNRAVLSEVLDRVEYIGKNLTSRADQPQYEVWVRQLLAPSVERLGYGAKAGESEDDRQLRAHVFRVDGEIGRDVSVIAWARDWTDKALEATTTPEYTLAATAFELAARDGDENLYDRFVKKQRQAKTPEEFYLYMSAMSSFHNPKLIERTLRLALSPEIRSQDALGVIADIMRQNETQAVAWTFVKSHWSEVEKVAGGVPLGQVVGAAASFCSVDLHNDAEHFFSEHKVPTAERRLHQSLEQIGYCTDLKSQQGPQLAQWLTEHEGNAGQ